MKLISYQTIVMYFSLLLYLIIVPKAYATSIIQEDFTNSDMSEWLIMRNYQWSNQSLPCMNDYIPAQWKILQGSLNIEINSRACVTEITKNAFIIPTEYSDYIFSFDMMTKTSINSDRNFAYFYLDENNWADIKMTGNTILFQQISNGQSQTNSLDLFNFDFIPDYWHKMKIVFGEEVDLYIDNQYVGSTSNYFYKSGLPQRFAFQASSGAIRTSSVAFDNLVVSVPDEVVDGVKLNVENLKQFQEPWGSQVYDSADTWAKPGEGTTFSDWACALTSAVEIMRYHGINRMENGDDLNPLSVNNWLLTNNGYLNGGYVSFASLTVLAKQLSVKYGTPALEYAATKQISSASSPDQVQLLQEVIWENIEADQPVILQKSGHFLVGTGFTQDKSDLYINDPAYNYEKFSQHNSPILSVRTLTPSYTDLRYLEIMLPENTEATLFDSDGAIVDAVETVFQTISPNSETPTVAPELHLIEVSKPAEGTYTLHLNNPESAGDVQVKSISRDGKQTVSTFEMEPASLLLIEENSDGQANIIHISPTPNPTPESTPIPTTPPSPTPTPSTLPAPTPTPTATPQPTTTPEPLLKVFSTEMLSLITSLEKNGDIQKKGAETLKKIIVQKVKNAKEIIKVAAKLYSTSLQLVKRKQLNEEGFLVIRKSLIYWTTQALMNLHKLRSFQQKKILLENGNNTDVWQKR